MLCVHTCYDVELPYLSVAPLNQSPALCLIVVLLSSACDLFVGLLGPAMLNVKPLMLVNGVQSRLAAAAYSAAAARANMPSLIAGAPAGTTLTLTHSYLYSYC